ncbi:MAG: hypothetical protein CML13_07300 [Puniceicoccaceae bacterium]|nr:hypothetical protein [Puniceicoccaceae bacterium]|tara:strand:+ start:29 stop:586 length:558 start_codon:yes stop_codon:yes gene_type:complete
MHGCGQHWVTSVIPNASMDEYNRARTYNNRSGFTFPEAPYSRLRYCFETTRDWGRLLCPDAAIEQSYCGVNCSAPLAAAYKVGLPLEVTARRYEVSLVHTYVFERFEREGYWAHCYGSYGGFSLDLYAVKRTVLHDDGGRLAWLLLGDGDAVLYELRAAREVAAETAWQQIMQTRLKSEGGQSES